MRMLNLDYDDFSACLPSLARCGAPNAAAGARGVSQAQARHASQSPLLEWLPVIVWGAVIFTLSTSAFTAANTARIIDPILLWLYHGMSAASLGVAHALVRKSGHFIEYGVLYCLLIRGPMAGRPYLTLLLCAAYALCDEGHQIFVPGRTPSLYDVALDTTGAAFGGFLRTAINELIGSARVQAPASVDEIRSIRS
jgi:VanZ family protein